MLIRNDYKPYMVYKKNKKIVTVIANSGSRLVKLTTSICLAFVGLVAYSFYVQNQHGEELNQKGAARVVRSIKEPALRGMITDRNGAVLAISRYVKIPTFNPREIYRPKRQGDPINWNAITDEQFTQLAALLHLPEGEVRAKLQNTESSYVNFKVRMTLEEADRLRALRIPSLRFEESTERAYPAGRLFSHVIGFANNDGEGKEGIELLRNNDLTGIDGKQIVLRDGRQNVVELVDSPENVKAQAGQTLVLSLDESLQRLAHQELAKAIEHFNAKAGAVVVLDAQSGEILAMSSLPDYDANYYSTFSQEFLRNYAVSTTFEPGSVMKPFVVAKALDDGKVRRDTWFNTEPYRVGNKLVRDTHHYPSLNTEGILQKSSNVGVSKIAHLYENNEDLYRFYRAIGLGQKTQSGVAGEQNVPIKPAQSWGKMDKTVMSFGYSITANLLQLAQAYTIFTTDGRLLPATIYKRDGYAIGTQVIKPETARQMREMMVSITQKGGTGQAGAIEGYHVAAKTGTARKVVDGRYEGKYRASFVGFAPAEQPRLIVAVVIDEPNGNGFYGGTVAGPVFREVMAGGLKLLGIKPTYVDSQASVHLSQR